MHVRLMSECFQSRAHIEVQLSGELFCTSLCCIPRGCFCFEYLQLFTIPIPTMELLAYSALTLEPPRGFQVRDLAQILAKFEGIRDSIPVTNI
jgi:hypothetical protein